MRLQPPNGNSVRALLLVAFMLMVAVGISVAFVGGATADQHITADRTLDATQAQPGETVGVTVTASSDSNDIGGLVDTFNNSFADVTLISATPSPGFQAISDTDVIVAYSDLVDQMTVEYEVTIPADAQAGQVFNFDGFISGDGSEVEYELENDTIEVVEGGTPDFTLSDLQPGDLVNNDAVDQGDTVSVSVNVSNVGTAAGVASVALSMDGTQVDQQDSPQIDPGNSQVVNLEIDTTGFDPGTYTYEVSVGDETASADIEVDHSVVTYADDQTGMVETQGLINAINDWRNGEFGNQLLLQIIDAWRNDTQVL